MKPHRQIRTSKRVGSETGVAIGADQPSKSFYGDKLKQVKEILSSMPHVERKRLLADAFKSVQEQG